MGFDYTQIKLFYLSVLWRAGVAKSHAFQQVYLGPFEPELRNILLTEKCPGEKRFPVFGCVLRNSQTKACLTDAVIPHTARRLDGVRVYVSVFAGCAFHYVVSAHSIPVPLSLILRESGHMYLPVLDDLKFPLITEFVLAHRKLENASRGKKK